MSSQDPEKTIVDGSDSIVIESTLPPTSSHQLLESEGATILVFSHDATLARVIRSVAADRYPIRIINEWNNLLEQVGKGVGRIVLLDVDALPDDAEGALADINRCSDWLVIVIAAKQQQAHDFMRFWSERRIHRLLIKPAAAGITRLLLESAFARFIELRELHENTDAMEIPHELVAEEQAKERRRWLWPALAAASAVCVIAAVLLYVLLPGEPEEQSTTIAAVRSAPAIVQQDTAENEGAGGAIAITPPDAVSEVPEPASASPDTFAEVLQEADAAEAAGRIVEPAGDSALDYYLSILGADPDHRIARERLDALLEQQFAIAQEQILERDVLGADITLGHIARANPGGTRLRFLQEQLRQLQTPEVIAEATDEVAAELTTEATQAGLEGNVPAPEISEPVVSNEQTELQSMLTLLRLRLSEGSLVEPPGDSAQDYLRRALDLGVDDAQIEPYVQQFAQLAVDAIPAALAAGNSIAANAMLSTAAELGSDNPGLAALEGEVAAAIAQIAREENLSLHALALRRIDDGIIVGREDSATALLDQLRDRSADPSLIEDLESRLSDALSVAARVAIADGRWNEADELLAAFSGSAIELPDIRALELDLAAARRQESYLAETIPVGEMTLLEAAPASYPRAAQTNEVTGWVDLHFTVNAEGTTGDIDVVAAEPRGQFEDAAIAALSGYLFEPWRFEERVYERRVRLRMRFELD